jgi:hypothetical protein
MASQQPYPSVLFGAVNVEVECQPEQHPWPTPRRLRFGNRVITVAEVVDRWFGADDQYVKIRSDDGRLYIVHHDRAANQWELTLYDRRGTER